MKAFATILALLVLILGYRLLVSDEGMREVWRLRGEVESQRAENAALAQRNLILEAEVADLKEGTDAIEERARSELGMTREGETKFTIVEAEPEEGAATPQ